MASDEYPRQSQRPEEADTSAPQVTASSELRPEDSEEFRDQYGYLRSYYRLRPRRYQSLQRWLNQARFGTNYDSYLADSALYAIATGILGVFVGVFVTLVLIDQGVVGSLTNPLSFSGDFTVYLGRNRGLFSAAILAVVAAVLFAAMTWYARYYYPRSIVGSRRRNIDMTLPHAITFMYALSYGGMETIEVIRVLSEATDTYGEVANEFKMIVRDIDLFGNDLYTALQNARNLTPSDNLEQFIDDLLSVLDAGGDVTVFFEEQTDTYLEEARDEQTAFIETLSLLSEVFVVLFVAAPLFLIVILIVMSLLGANTITEVTLLVYLVMPLAMGGFLVLLDILSAPFMQADVKLETEHHVTNESVSRLLVLACRDAVEATGEWVSQTVGRTLGQAPSAVDAEEHVARQKTTYLRRRRRQHLIESLDTPLAVFERNPMLTLVVMMPVALGWLGLVVSLDIVAMSREAFLAAPDTTTLWLIVIPLLLVIVPLSLFVERKGRRERNIAKQFPDTMNALSSANKMGVPTTDALNIVAKWSTGPTEEELRKVRNDIGWNNDTTRSLRSFADRLRVPQLSRAIKLIAEGMRSSSDLARVFSIAADDTRNRFRIEQQRRRELTSYIAVVIIGFLVYLLVVSLLTRSYLEPVSAASSTASPTDVETPISISNLPVAAYETLFFHSALIQAFGSGLLAGKLVDNRALSGLKYSIFLILLSTIAFLLV
ncbi:type II secretion system F family protein [Haloarcula marismortui]|jgi:flagellar protein FlaJ|uniref:Type IV pilus biogenesis complex membrane subunit n=1 Tax=Haloarcula marismortui ATCC 33799 TaxID=662475 RepID=M0KLH0_9EURY|nr:type II secretion system F family protein [Haloarcula californiae]EMA20660.1 type IV pilus biogenesis complex membrane subunit [Haloarcula californiae ATCC 33799]